MAIRSKGAVGSKGNGRTKKLNAAALKVVDEKAPEIADSLYKSTLKGHVESLRLLVDLAEGALEGDEAMNKRPARSQAQELAMDPPWQGEDPDAADEVAMGKGAQQ
jgi:hypothetical protein